MDSQMKLLRITPKPQIGLAFESSGLTLLQGWAKSHGTRMVVEMDHAVEGDEARGRRRPRIGTTNSTCKPAAASMTGLMPPPLPIPD